MGLRYKRRAGLFRRRAATHETNPLKKNWPADIQAYDQGHEHMLMFSDALSAGIVKQFPKKFVN